MTTLYYVFRVFHDGSKHAKYVRNPKHHWCGHVDANYAYNSKRNLHVLNHHTTLGKTNKKICQLDVVTCPAHLNLQPSMFQRGTTTWNLICDNTVSNYVGNHMRDCKLRVGPNYDYTFERMLHVLKHHKTLGDVQYNWMIWNKYKTHLSNCF